MERLRDRWKTTLLCGFGAVASPLWIPESPSLDGGHLKFPPPQNQIVLGQSRQHTQFLTTRRDRRVQLALGLACFASVLPRNGTDVQ